MGATATPRQTKTRLSCGCKTYNPETDEYTCYNNKLLKPVYVFYKKSATGYVSEATVYECESCEDCPHKAKCTKAKGNRRMEVSKTFIESRQKSFENITSERRVLLRVNRSIQVEACVWRIEKR